MIAIKVQSEIAKQLSWAQQDKLTSINDRNLEHKEYWYTCVVNQAPEQLMNAQDSLTRIRELLNIQTAFLNNEYHFK